MIRFSKRLGRISAVTLGDRQFIVGTQGEVHCGKGKVSISVLLLKVPFPCSAAGSPSPTKAVLKQKTKPKKPKPTKQKPEEKGQEIAFLTQSFNPIFTASLYAFIVIYYFLSAAFLPFITTISVLLYLPLIAHPLIHCLVPAPACHTLLHTQSPPATLCVQPVLSSFLPKLHSSTQMCWLVHSTAILSRCLM